MDISSLPIDERLAKYQLYFDVALTDEVVKQQEKEYGEKLGASDELDAARAEAYETYIDLVGLARIALKRDRNLQSQLDLGGEREKAHDESYMQMLNFYDAALNSPEIQNKLARFNVTPDKLNAGKALVAAIQEKKQARLKEASEAQRATHDRDEAMSAIDDWMSDFIGVSRIALRKHPEYLERLGLVDPS